MASTVPVPVLGPTGYVLPEEADILAAVLADMNAAFGGGMNTSLSTPQGQLATSIAAIIADRNNQFLDLVSHFDPQYAYGRTQDGIGQIYFINRIPGSPTLVTCVCTGLAGTMIPAGSFAKDSMGNIYQCLTAGMIDINGSVNLIFVNVVNGPVPCPTGTLNVIYGAIPGWDTITNPSAGVLGRSVETAQEFEFRRRGSVALNSTQNLSAVYSAVACSGENLSPPVVPIDVYVAENRTDQSVFQGGVLLLPHSLYVAAVGGNPTEIAKAIFLKASFGCQFQGDQVITVPDDVNYNYPYPMYEIKYTVPIFWETKFIVTLLSNPQLPADIGDGTLIKQAIIDAFAGLDGGPSARIGTTLYASRFYAPIAALDRSVGIVSILMGHSVADSNSMSVNINQYPIVSEANIQVVLV